MVDISQIKEHMAVIGADGVPVGTVDGIEGDHIKLTRADSSAGFDEESHAGHHHFLPVGLVATIEGDTVRLSANADVAVDLFEEEADGDDDDDSDDDGDDGDDDADDDDDDEEEYDDEDALEDEKE